MAKGVRFSVGNFSSNFMRFEGESTIWERLSVRCTGSKLIKKIF